jgi:ABC-2 type transport system ATP-binding protein
MIDVENLVKHYGPVRAVDGVSFAVQPGEVVGLLGPNGAGKSTTLRVLTGYLPSTAGRVRVADRDIRQNPIEARARVGYLSESNPLYESLGVWESLEITAGLRGFSGGEARRRAHLAAERCSLGEVADKDVSELSKGYRQRLGLALAILHDPEVLVLDEPTSALDPNQRKEVRDLILHLREKKTVLLSTHILSEAEELCDRLLIIHQGSIVASGTVADVRALAGGATSYYVRLQGPADEMLLALRSLPGAAGAERVDEQEPGCPGYRLDAAEDPRPAVFRLASERRWPIMELRRQTASLDEVFRSLTGGKS